MSTLSAVHAHPLLTPHWKHFLVDAVRAMINPVRRQERIHYPPPLNFFVEDAAMAREMLRL